MLPIPEIILAPVPARAMVCGLPDASSVIDKTAERAPITDGLKVKLIWQLTLGPKDVPQLFDSPKSAGFVPPSAMEGIFSVASPMFERMTNCEIEVVVPTSWLKKFIEVAEREAIGAIPVPLSPLTSGLVPVSLETLTAAVLFPREVGENVTLIAQVAETASVAPQVFP